MRGLLSTTILPKVSQNSRNGRCRMKSHLRQELLEGLLFIGGHLVGVEGLLWKFTFLNLSPECLEPVLHLVLAGQLNQVRVKSSHTGCKPINPVPFR